MVCACGIALLGKTRNEDAWAHLIFLSRTLLFISFSYIVRPIGLRVVVAAIVRVAIVADSPTLIAAAKAEYTA
jgi:hypothetical protein